MPTFAERTAQTVAKEYAWKQYNSKAPFFADDITKSLSLLAEKTFPTDIINRNAYQEAIAKSLTETLSPEIGVKDFWLKMGEVGCKELNIENGHLYFYDKNSERIDITPYTQPIVFEGHSSYYNQRELERKERIQEAHKQLEELIAEINTGK